MIAVRPRSSTLIPSSSAVQAMLPARTRVGASDSDSFWVHGAKLLGYGVLLPVGVGGLMFGKVGMIIGAYMAASIVAQDIYDGAIRS